MNLRTYPDSEGPVAGSLIPLSFGFLLCKMRIKQSNRLSGTHFGQGFQCLSRKPQEPASRTTTASPTHVLCLYLLPWLLSQSVLLVVSRQA